MRRIQQLTSAAYEDHVGSPVPRFPNGRGARPALPGLLDVRTALEWAEWRGRQARRILRTFKRGASRGSTVWKLAVTLENGKWVIGEDQLTSTCVTELRKQVQRAAKRIKPPFMLTGMVDLAPVRDSGTGLRAWSLHLHLTVFVEAPTSDAAKASIHAAFPYKEDQEKGVLRPVYVDEIYDLKGWDNYQNKAFRLDGITQRIVRRDPDGKRRETDKRPLTRAQRATVAGFYSRVNPDSLMVWLGHRRYGRRLQKM